MGQQPGFFDVEERLKRLSDLGDQLEAFARAVDYEQFRPVLDAALAYADGAKGGRPPLDPVMMFKVLIIQATNGLGRAGGVSDQRPALLHALPCFVARRPRPGCARATLVAAPRGRNTAAEKAEIKAGRIPAEWKAKPAKLRHKD